MQPERFVDLDGPLWYPMVAAVSDNAGAREDEDGLYWTNYRAATSALMAAKGRLPAPVPLWVRGSTTTPGETEVRAREVLGEHVVLGDASTPSADIAIHGFVATIEILGGADMKQVATLLRAAGLDAWTLRPVLNKAGEVHALPMLGRDPT